MKKTVLFLLCALLYAPGFAQKAPLKFLSRFSMHKPRVPAARVLRNVQGKKFLPDVRPALPAGSAEMEKFVFHPVRLTEPGNLRVEFTPASSFQTTEILIRYQIVMGRFKDFKKEMDPFLSYQLRPSSRRDLHPVERAHILSRAADMETELTRLAAVISPKDEALLFAREYTDRVKMEVAPILKGMSSGAPRFSRMDRTFNGDEFYLHKDETKRWLSMLRRGRALRLAAQLPQGLRVAVLNDRASVLEKMQSSHKNGVFIGQGSLDCFSSAEDLLFAIRDLDRQYDLILTDIIVPGGGGYYVTAELRLDGYEGVIIALSAFERDDAMALDMFERGFDGMLNLPMSFEFSPFWESDVMRGLRNYFQLRDVNGWRR